MSGDAGGVGMQRANAALKRAKDAKAAADSVAANLARTGIKATNGQFTAQLPEGVVRILAPFYDKNTKRLLGGFDGSLNWLANGLRLLKFGKLSVGQHAITSGNKSDFPVRFRDKRGNSLLLMDRRLRWLMNHLKVYGDGEVSRDLVVGRDLSVAGQFSPTGGIGDDDGKMIVAETNWAWWVRDKYRNTFLGVRESDVHLMHVGRSAKLRMLFADSANKARTAAANTLPHNYAIAALTATRALIVADGQSVSTSYEGYPAISKTARTNITFSMGLSVRSASSTWTPQGDASLHPLIGTVEPVAASSTKVPMADADVAAIDPANSALYEGENLIVAATNGLARKWLTIPGAPPRKFIAVSTGFGGHAIEQLMPGRPEWARFTGAVDMHKSLAVAAGETWNIASVTINQGEANYEVATGVANDGPTYKTNWLSLRGSQVSYIQSAGQAEVPAYFIHTTSGVWVIDAMKASISMAQVELALENPGVFIVGPNYPVTDKGGHLDSNGYRWIGVMNAKKQRKVLIDRINDEPFWPYKIEVIGKWVYLHMGGAVGRIQIAPVWNRSVQTLFADAGFKCGDAGGFCTIVKTEVIGSTILGIQLDRAPDPATGLLWYAADSVHGGQGNLCDSDPTRSEEVYEYITNSGMYAAANIPALIGNPYPLNNWCTPFVLPLTYSR